MSVLDDTFNPAALTRSDTLASTPTTAKGTAVASSKTTKAGSSIPRLDYEPLYLDLKSLIGDNWGIYSDALARFIRGELSANEFSDLCDHFLLALSSTEHAHNRLVCAIIHNSGRDSPELGPAAWVSSAVDKASGTSASKPTVTSDASEQRLKKEIMAFHPRDRVRIKTSLQDQTGNKAPTPATAEEEAAHIRAAYEQYYNGMRIKPPETVATTAGAGLTRTNWELEIRKRYVQPLYSETMEFPDSNTVHGRLVPICYEEGITAGASAQCSELVVVAAETLIKNMLHDFLTRVRVNGPRYDYGAAGGVLTSRYRRQLNREEALVKAGKLQRSRDDDLLPVESKAAQARRPLGISDFKLADRVGPTFWNGKPMTQSMIDEHMFAMNDIDEWYDTQATQPMSNGAVNGTTVNGVAQESMDDDMDMDEDDLGWEGTTAADQATLQGLLGGCLSIGAT